MVRSCFVVMKNSIGYAFGYEGLGFRANNPVYMLRAQFPELVPSFGLLASGLFGLSYCTTNIIFSAKAKKWDKKRMLGIALIGMSLSMIGSGTATSLPFFCFNRWLFGLFAAGINAPIYQLIASNFPPQYRSTANAIENSGYYMGSGFASFMILAIKSYGWRSMYFIAGGVSITLALLNQLFVKNPVIPNDPTPKATEEEEDALLNIAIKKDLPPQLESSEAKMDG
jgi:MFS family permease